MSVAASPIVVLAFAARSPLAVNVPEKLAAAALTVPVKLGDAIVLLVKVSVVFVPTRVVVASGKLMTLSDVGSVIANKVSKASSVEPSKDNGLAP